MSTYKYLMTVCGAAVLALGLAACGSSSSSDSPPADDTSTMTPTEPTPDPAIAQRENVTTAITAATAALATLNTDLSDATDAEITAVQTAVTTAKAAIDAATDVPASEVAAHTTSVGTIESALASAQTSITAARNEAYRQMRAAARADAAKLYKGLGEDPLTNGTEEAFVTGDLAVTRQVQDAAVTSTLTPDTDMVAALQGWEGKQYSMESDGVEYTAVVYSNTDDPEAMKFSDVYDGEGGNPELDADGELPLATILTAAAARVDSPSFGQSAGEKTFELGENQARVVVPGTFDGAAGTYYCTPAQGDLCGATVAADGFTLGGGIWMFKPTGGGDGTVYVRDTTSEHFGWWIRESADGFIASAFAFNDADVGAASGILILQGSATYVGPAAGKYALSASLGSPNDAGHFTAAAKLDADFSNNMISGSISNFMGADGQLRNWSVALKKVELSDAGVFTTPTDVDGAGAVWSIGGEPGAASGNWSGALFENDTAGVPEVATGTFQATYDLVGRIVGAFGANQQ